MNRVKTPKESYIEMREIVLPQHTNYLNTAFGGTVMSWIDIAASMSASKHSNKTVVTVHVDEINFITPVKMGEHVLIKAQVGYVGRTSMVVSVDVFSDNPFTEKLSKTTAAYLTFVALNEDGKPCEVPSLDPKTEEDKKVFETIKKRVELNRKLRKES